MNLRWISKISILALFLLISCGKNHNYPEVYYTIEKAEEWSKYSMEIGIGSSNLPGSIFIIANSAACSPCISEIQHWNLVRDDLDNEIFLILTEKHNYSYYSFLSKLNVQLPVFQDSTGLIFEKDLTPFPPVKFYFDKDGAVKLIYPVGAGGEIGKFLNQIKELQ